MSVEQVWHSDLTPLHFLTRSALVFRDRTAVIHGEKRYSYAQFAERVNRLAAALRGAGIEKGDRVAFLTPNIPPLLEAHFAVPLAGGVLVAINTRLQVDEITYIVNHSGAKMLFVDTELAVQLAGVRGQMGALRQVVNVDEAGGPRLDGPEYEEFVATGAPNGVAALLEDEQEMIAINYTSGTTGSPKGVMYSHRAAYLNSLAQVFEMHLDSDSVYLWTLPMFHCNGWCYTWATIAAGAANLCLRKIEPGVVWPLIQRESVTHLCAAPTVLISLVNDPAINRLHLERKLRVATGGAPPSPTLIEEMGRVGAEITHVYGLTETYGPNTVCEWQSQWDDLSLNERARIKARQGVSHIISGAGGVRVVDEEMRDVPADGETMGEVVMRGNTVMKGYYLQPEATAEAFRGGWFHSGDLGVMQPDGYVELRDRKKDIIISGGENISTIEVERVIAQHPDVLEVAVIAVPDPKWGEVPKAFVTRKAGATVMEQELIAFCRERLAHFKCPKTIDFGDLPKTSTGKIQKFVLREQEWAGKDKRIQ